MPYVLPPQLLLASLQQNGLIPLLIPNGFQPSVQLDVTYNGKSISAGDKLTKEETSKEPQVAFLDTDNLGGSTSYTIVLTDPDAPSKQDPKYGPWRHWVQSGYTPVNIQSLANAGQSDFQTSEATSMPFATTNADATTPYLGPGPPPGSGPHRYTFLLYREPEEHTVSSDDVIGNEFTQRRNWNLEAFVEKKGLTLVGTTFFIVEG